VQQIGKKISLAAGPLAGLGIGLFTELAPGEPQVAMMAGIVLWMAIWWMTEAVPVAATALIPVFMLPLSGIADASQTAEQYMDPILFLFIGGFMIAIAIEKWNLHKRIALRILMKVGAAPPKVLFGIMLTSWLMSMWISNTATVMMMLAAVMALISKMSAVRKDDQFAKAILLGLAYASSIGGMATLVGTPTNMIFLRAYSQQFPDAAPIHFSSWMAIAFPMSLLLLVICYLILKRLFLRDNQAHDLPKDYFKEEYLSLGKATFEEKTVGIIFALTAFLWISRADFEIGNYQIKGWSALFSYPTFLSDGAVAVVMALLLFIIPSRQEPSRALLTWSDAERLPFGIILLFGGGFALAMGVQQSGLSTWLAQGLHFASNWHPFVFLIAVVAFVSILTEFTSNMSSIQLIIPILIPLSEVLEMDALLLLIPATIAASMCFMLPVATGPNTIVFGTGHLRVPDMMRAGIWLNIVGMLIVSVYMYLIL
jgi:solute carrier family 13 (sodium-dependent dicarboxylate transporter), member 2/3/5